MSNININYNDTFSSRHSRDYYRGTSFHFSGTWAPGVHYVCDEYNVDFISYNQVFLVCSKSHLSTTENKPEDFIWDDQGNIIGVVSDCWEFVLSGSNGHSPGIRINPTSYNWEICDNIDRPIEQQVWVDTGVSAVGFRYISQLINDSGFVSAEVNADTLILET